MFYQGIKYTQQQHHRRKSSALNNFFFSSAAHKHTHVREREEGSRRIWVEAHPCTSWIRELGLMLSVYVLDRMLFFPHFVSSPLSRLMLLCQCQHAAAVRVSLSHIAIILLQDFPKIRHNFSCSSAVSGFSDDTKILFFRWVRRRGWKIGCSTEALAEAKRAGDKQFWICHSTVPRKKGNENVMTFCSWLWTSVEGSCGNEKVKIFFWWFKEEWTLNKKHDGSKKLELDLADDNSRWS